jgi:hypothetical protein
VNRRVLIEGVYAADGRPRMSWLRWRFDHTRLIRLRSFIVITLSALGLWAAVWQIVASLASW